MKQVHLYISGFVQGVGYRVFVRSEAKKLGINGWVRNLSDNRVEVVAQGDKEVLQKFIKICEKGPFLSDVKDVSITWEDAREKFFSFNKLPTQ